MDNKVVWVVGWENSSNSSVFSCENFCVDTLLPLIYVERYKVSARYTRDANFFFFFLRNKNNSQAAVPWVAQLKLQSIFLLGKILTSIFHRQSRKSTLNSATINSTHVINFASYILWKACPKHLFSNFNKEIIQDIALKYAFTLIWDLIYLTKLRKKLGTKIISR